MYKKAIYFLIIAIALLIPFLPTSVVHSQTNETTVGGLTLAATFRSISVYSVFTGDDNEDNSVVIAYEINGSGNWKPTTTEAFIADRDLVVWDRDQGVNPYTTTGWQYRGSIVGLTADMEYRVRVTYSDGDGITGTNPVYAIITTRNDVIPLGSGNVYYVAKDGNDSTGDGSEETPWLTIQKAADMVSVGDTVYIKVGTYSETVTMAASGTIDNYITFRNYASDEVIVDGGDTRTNCIYMSGIDYINVKGLTLRYSTKQVIEVYDGKGILIEDCEIYDGVNPDYLGLVDFSSSDSQNCIVRNNHIYLTRSTADQCFGIRADKTLGGHIFYDNHIDGSVNHYFYDPIGGHANSSWNGGPGPNTDIYDNELHGYVDDAVELEGGGVNIRVWGNEIYDSGRMGISIAPIIQGPTYIFRNLIYDMTDGAYKTGGGANGALSVGPVFYYHNTMVGARGQAQYGNTNISANQHSRNNVWHNANRTISSTPARSIGHTWNYDLFWNTGSYVILWNSVEYDGTSEFETFVTTIGVDYGMELSNMVYANTLFTDAGSDNYTLQSGSPAIDVGMVLPGFNNVNSDWPSSGSAPDMGAYEYASGLSVSTTSATSVEETTSTLNGNITDIDGGNADYRGFVWDTVTHSNPGDTTPGSSDYASNWTESGSFGIGSFNHNLTGLTKGELYYSRAVAHDTVSWVYGVEVTFLTKPDEPSNLQSTGETSTTISLSWDSGTGADYAIVRYSTGDYPGDRTAGSSAYYGAGTSTEVEDLNPNTTYYFRAWSHTTEGGRNSYSDNYSQVTTATEASPSPPAGRTQEERGYTSIVLAVTLSLAGLILIPVSTYIPGMRPYILPIILTLFALVIATLIL